MFIGADYYPEHWPESRWETDAKLMKEAGFNIVRLAEFAWVNMEPAEGVFDFEWLDRALDVLSQQGISAIMCTPTAVMPAWLARKYPETLATDANGKQIVWGVRKNNCFTSGAYRLLSERITTAMAKHFADAGNVVGWQTDNEFGHPVCYCDTCRKEFQAWLKEKYGSLDGLNKAWGMHFWGHLAQTWDEVFLPVNNGNYNPSACLDWKRFYSWLNVRFQRDQVKIIRELCPSHFITHNFMGLFPHLNYYDLAEDLDFVSWDNYPVGSGLREPFHAAMAADLMRSVKKKNFWIMEQTAGCPGWGTFARNPRPGEIRQIAYQQLSHGADGQVWFRWRTCSAGREQYWHGLLAHDGKPFRRYQEAAKTAGEYRKLEELLEGTTVKADVAMIYDYDSLWAFQIQPCYGGEANYQEAAQRYYRALLKAGVNVDFIAPGEDFSKYKLILAPHLYILPDSLAEKINTFVDSGGVFLTDCRAAVKNETSLCHERTLPGLLADMLGIEIQEYESITGDQAYETESDIAELTGCSAVKYADWLIPKTAQSLAGYKPWHMKEYALLTKNQHGAGRGWYVGGIVKEKSFYDKLIEDLLNDAGIEFVADLPEGVEVSLRQSDTVKLLFVMNHTENVQEVSVPPGKVELLTEAQTGDTIALDRYGVAVIKL